VVAQQIHLVRHGEVFNPDRVLYERIPGFGLSGLGQAMAGTAAANIKLRHRAVTRLVSSPLQRTKESAAPFAKLFDLEVELDDRVIEPTNHFAGKRMRGKDSALKQPGNWRFLLNPFRPSWGEPYRQVADRMISAMNEIGQTTVSGDVVIVSHQLSIWMAHRAIAGKPFIHDPRHRRCALSSITTFEFVDPALPELGFREVGYANPAERLNEGALDVGAV
jgi:broad specificity phosphatase PhoE